MTEMNDQASFVIEHGQTDVVNGGYFTPVARLIVQPALRTSGLLAALPDREAKSLLLLLTFLTPNGRIEPTTAHLASALQVPQIVVRSRLGKLTSFRWQGERIVHHVFHETGMDAYRLSPSLVTERQALKEGKLASRAEAVSEGAGSRDAVIAFSRAAYGHPREEVERDIERRLGVLGEALGITALGTSESPELREVRRRLIFLGVSPAQVERLLATYPLPDIREQLDFLPDRNAKSPARYVVAAIEGYYEPPPRVRLERAIAEAEATEAADTGGE